MQQLEDTAQSKFDAPMKDRVWNKISGTRLKTLRDTLTLAFCDKILSRFNEEESKAMLEEHKKTGTIKNLKYSIPLQQAYATHLSSVIDAVVQKTESMAHAWMPEIINAVKSEGIKLQPQ